MNALYEVRPEAREFDAYVPGLSIEEIRQKYGLANIIKLASNENPLGVSPIVEKALRDHAPEAFRYPRCGNPELNARLADHFGVPVERVVTGNGSDEIIDLLVRVKARPGQDNVVAFKPCFSMYELCSRMCGVEFRQVPLAEDFSFPFDELIDTCDENTALVFITSPDNPTGYTATSAEILDLAARLPERAILVVDEAYVDFADEPEQRSVLPHLAELENVVMLRTFSKAYGLAGLRLGAGVVPGWLGEMMRACQIPFSVNILAVYAGLAALSDRVFYQETLRVVREGRANLAKGLAALGCEVSPSQANFLMFRLPEGSPEARQAFEGLLARGVIVRPLASYGMPDRMRVSVGTRRENDIFLKTLGEVLHG
ncbi:Histidinol-phosphate aminotransferase [Desulfovibrio sp. X2]|uniref:histidinol-phosphate transaminase n=1 Tax=Desulfovibrio sp. X2 TaxID=941449 RepID=UPI000358D7BA|nr:histidinol-phosphate transaminase [Desulfovibrio sp. X2]EPR37076.1 Histidinol-phosphate aminotransferase [Desulfovibrio sp. X2]